MLEVIKAFLSLVRKSNRPQSTQAPKDPVCAMELLVQHLKSGRYGQATDLKIAVSPDGAAHIFAFGKPIGSWSWENGTYVWTIPHDPRLRLKLTCPQTAARITAAQLHFPCGLSKVA